VVVLERARGRCMCFVFYTLSINRDRASPGEIAWGWKISWTPETAPHAWGGIPRCVCVCMTSHEPSIQVYRPVPRRAMDGWKDNPTWKISHTKYLSRAKRRDRETSRSRSRSTRVDAWTSESNDLGRSRRSRSIRFDSMRFDSIRFDSIRFESSRRPGARAGEERRGEARRGRASPGRSIDLVARDRTRTTMD